MSSSRIYELLANEARSTQLAMSSYTTLAHGIIVFFIVV